MRWMIWPRQYGKTYQVTRWFRDHPAGRVILTENEPLAVLRREELELDTPPGFTAASWRKHLKTHVMSFRSWQSSQPGRPPYRGEIAVDGADVILSHLLRGEVTVITGVGVNDSPVPAAAARADSHHERMARILGMPKESIALR